MTQNGTMLPESQPVPETWASGMSASTLRSECGHWAHFQQSSQVQCRTLGLSPWPAPHFPRAAYTLTLTHNTQLHTLTLTHTTCVHTDTQHTPTQHIHALTHTDTTHTYTALIHAHTHNTQIHTHTQTFSVLFKTSPDRCLGQFLTPQTWFRRSMAVTGDRTGTGAGVWREAVPPPPAGAGVGDPGPRLSADI